MKARSKSRNHRATTVRKTTLHPRPLFLPLLDRPVPRPVPRSFHRLLPRPPPRQNCVLRDEVLQANGLINDIRNVLPEPSKDSAYQAWCKELEQHPSFQTWLREEQPGLLVLDSHKEQETEHIFDRLASHLTQRLMEAGLAVLLLRLPIKGEEPSDFAALKFLILELLKNFPEEGFDLQDIFQKQYLGCVKLFWELLERLSGHKSLYIIIHSSGIHEPQSQADMHWLLEEFLMPSVNGSKWSPKAVKVLLTPPLPEKDFLERLGPHERIEFRGNGKLLFVHSTTRIIPTSDTKRYYVRGLLARMSNTGPENINPAPNGHPNADTTHPAPQAIVTPSSQAVTQYAVAQNTNAIPPHPICYMRNHLVLGTQASYLRDVLRVDRRIVETAWRHSRCANDDKINDASSKLRHQFWPIIESSGSCCVHLVRAGDDADPTLFGGLALKIVDNLQSPPDINPQWRGYTVLGFQYGNASRFEDHAGPGYCFFLRSLLGQLLSSCLSTATFYPQDFPPEVPSPWTATPYGA
ncbi:hypothetical protein BU26DRAFT_501271 [Trematosphaeria pertusa]|uniref:Uncharacterized protein n=1 Tax=Trematosphaeria pertusa TaxID=390896 RepID=A0A6A6IR29_9PLEO|nr:uncharacterized protein BU26DRAFT_501271 [Trematosphaeria pertusa]KAF2253005.1 hypothetical protein BU26DRAFT_501271 [Trematosphaeria pertusa]